MTRPPTSSIVGFATVVALALGPVSGASADARVSADAAQKVGDVVSPTRLAEPNGAGVSTGAETADPAAPLRWVASVETSSRDYRWSLARGALDFGLAFDAARPRGVALGLDPRPEIATAAVGDALPALSVGVRHDAPGVRPPASTLLQRVSGVATADAYVGKVGVQWKPAQSQVNFLREGLGFRLDGTNRMTVRLRKGVVGLYMQRKF